MARKFSDLFKRRPIGGGAPDDTSHGEAHAHHEHARFAQLQAKKLWETVSRNRHKATRSR